MSIKSGWKLRMGASKLAAAWTEFRTSALTSPRRSVGTRLTLLIIAGILLCVLLLGFFSYYKSSSVIQDKVAEANMLTAEQTSGRLNLLLDNYEQKLLQTFLDPNFSGLLNTMDLAEDESIRADSAFKVRELLLQIRSADNTLDGITLIPLEGDAAPISTNARMTAEVVKQFPYISKIKEANGNMVWVPTMPQGIDGQHNVPTLALGKLVNFVKPYVLLYEIRYHVLNGELKDVRFGESGSAYVVTPEGTIVFASDESLLGTAYPHPIPTEPQVISIDGIESLSTASAAQSNGWIIIGNIPVAELVKDAKQIRDFTFLISLGALVIAALMGWMVYRTVAKPLMQLRGLMNEGEKGNLTVRASIRQKDEIGQVAESFNRMMDQITELVRQAGHSAREVLNTAASLADVSRKTATAAKEIAAATEGIADGASNLAVEAERGSDMTSHISSRIQLVIETNKQMGQAASEVEAASRKGSEYMDGLIVKTGQTETMTRQMAEKVEMLKESTGSIVKILDVLGAISKQTNILSLNATIEAARAGAAGKGFMVVADEIRQLADRSRESIDVVSGIVDNIQREIEETVSVLSEAYPIFQEQVDSVRETNEIFSAVQENMSGFMHRLDAASESVHQLREAQEALAQAMENVSAVAEEASATTEEVASLSNEQLGISDGLVELSARLEVVSKALSDSLARFTIQ